MKNTIKNKTKNANKKQSLLFSFCNIFDVLTSRTQKIAWSPPAFKPDFYIFSYNEKFKEIRSTSFYCIIPP